MGGMLLTKIAFLAGIDLELMLMYPYWFLELKYVS
jgi:hypothetical protein